MAFLVVDRPGGTPEVMELIHDPFTIGKRSTSDLVLREPAVSRDHCEIVDGGHGKHFLRDKGSRNGTFVAGHKVGGDLLLRDGMELQVGPCRIIFRQAAITPATTLKAADAPAAKGPQEDHAPEPAGSATEVFLAPPEGAEAPPPAGPEEHTPRPWDREQATPVELKRQIHAALLEKLDLKHEDFERKSQEEIRAKTERVIGAIVGELADQVPAYVRQEELVREIADEALGLGPLEYLLADSEVDEIMVNGWDRVYVERFGKIEKTGLRFTDNQQVTNIIRRIVSPIGRRIDESSPMVDARLPDGSRVNAIIPPLAISGPTLTVRKFAAEPFTVSDMVAFGTLSEPMAQFLQVAVESRQNILISGGTGSGKTTLLNVISSFIGPQERIVTIEDAAELNLPQEHVVSLEAKAPNIRGEGAIPIRKLVINSLRMRPDRIIVGECRGGEALDMLQAMNTGHDGSLTTLHANGPRDSLRRLETMVLMAGMDLPSRAIREQIASAMHLIVHTARLTDGTRKVVQIDEITGMEGDTFVLQDLFLFRQRGFDEGGRVRGYHTATGLVPDFVGKMRERGISVEPHLFEPDPQEQAATAAKKGPAQR